MRSSPPILFLSVLAFAGFAQAQDPAAQVAAMELGRVYEHAFFRAAAKHPDARTRLVAARAGGRIKDARAIEWLLALLDDDAGPVRRQALFSLGRIGGDAIVIPLRSALARMAENDLPFALEALGRSRDPRAVSAVVAHLKQASHAVRGAAALALFRLGDDSALPEVFGALATEEDPEARWRMVYTAFRLLRGKLRGRTERLTVDDAWLTLLRASALPREAKDRPFHERVFAALALGATKGGVDDCISLTQDEDPRVVVAALRGLRGPWDIEVVKALSNNVGNHDHQLVREEWIRWLISMIPETIDREPQTREAREAADALSHRAGTVLQFLSGGAGAGGRGWTDLETLAMEGAAQASFVMPGRAQVTSVGADDENEERVWRVNAAILEQLPKTLPKTVKAQATAAEVCSQERMPRAKALEILEQLLKIKDFTVRATAISSIVKRGGKHLVEQIVAAAEDSPGTIHLDVRLEACKALAEMGEYHKWLDDAAKDPDWPVRDAARKALEKLERPLPPKIERAGFRLHGHDAAAVVEAATALRGAKVRLKTNRGDIVMVLLPEEAPAHCVNFATLVKRGFYDNLTWHRVVADFVIQGGCPRGDGWGGPGFMLPDEIGLRQHYVRGTVGMPKSDDDTGGCQIFITHLPTPHLDGRYTVYAQLVEGLAVMDRIRVGDRIERATLELEPPR